MNKVPYTTCACLKERVFI